MSPTPPDARTLGQLVGREDVAAARQQTRRLQAADAHERHRELVEQGGGTPHERLIEEHAPRRGRAHAARRRQERGLRSEQVGQATHQVGRVAFRSRVAAATEDLDHADVGQAADRVHRVDHGEQRRAPRGHTDHVPGAHRLLQVVRGRVAQLARDVVGVVGADVHDLRVLEPVALR